MKRIPPLAVVLATAVFALVLDQGTKALVRATMPLNSSVWVVPGVLSLNHVRNAGAAFSLLPGRRTLFVLVAFVVLAAVGWVWWRYRPTQVWLNMALGLVVGGSVGNLIDRASTGLVTDFIDVQVFPVWNVADMCIVGGVAVLVLWLLFGQHTPAASDGVAEGPDDRAAKGPSGDAGGRHDDAAEQR
jgi:signal peptidase II